MALWPFKATIGSREGLTFATDVLPAFAAEQRIALAYNARRELSHRYVMTPQQADTAYSLISASALAAWQVPEWQEATTVSVTAGAASIAVDTTYRQYRAPGFAVLWKDWDDYELLTVTAVNAGSIEVDAVNATWTDAKLMPCCNAYLPDGLDISLRPGPYYEASADWQSFESDDWASSWSGLTYLGDPVIASGCEIGDATVRGRILQPNNVVDNGIARTLYDSSRAQAFRSHALAWVAEGQAETFDIRALLYYLRGRVRAFWLPTRVPIRVISNANAGTSSLVVAGSNLTSGALYVQPVTGSPFVAAYSGASGTDPQTLTLSSPLPANVTTAAKVSRLLRLRLDANRVEFDYLGRSIMRATTPAIEVPL